MKSPGYTITLIMVNERRMIMSSGHAWFINEEEIRIGESRRQFLQQSPQSSKRWFSDWGSRRKATWVRVNCEFGVSATVIAAMYRNGCSKNGESSLTLVGPDNRSALFRISPFARTESADH